MMRGRTSMAWKLKEPGFPLGRQAEIGACGEMLPSSEVNEDPGKRFRRDSPCD